MTEFDKNGVFHSDLGEVKCSKMELGFGGFGSWCIAYVKIGNRYFRNEMNSGMWMGFREVQKNDYDNAEAKKNYSWEEMERLVVCAKNRFSL